MHAEQRRVANDGLHYLTIFPDDYDADADYPLVVMLHGFGANMQDLASPCAVHKPEGLRVRMSQCADTL